jgi:hypothetical protein
MRMAARWVQRRLHLVDIARFLIGFASCTIIGSSNSSVHAFNTEQNSEIKLGRSFGRLCR